MSANAEQAVHGLFAQYRGVVALTRDQQVIFALAEGINRQKRGCHPAGFTDKRFDYTDAPRVGCIVENNLAFWQFALQRVNDEGIPQGVIEPEEVRLARSARQLVEAGRYRAIANPIRQ